VLELSVGAVEVNEEHLKILSVLILLDEFINALDDSLFIKSVLERVLDLLRRARTVGVSDEKRINLGGFVGGRHL